MGEITLDRPYSMIHVGLPIVAEVELLDMDRADLLIRGSKKKVSHIDLIVESARGVFAGPDSNNLMEYKPHVEEDYGVTRLVTGLIEIPLVDTWEETGRVLIRQTDPLPVALLGAMPHGEIGG
jgi:hypothetical protein